MTPIAARLRRVLSWLFNPPIFMAIIMSLLPLYMVLLYVDATLYNTPIYDQWVLSLDIASKTETGTLTLGDMIQVHNGHRLFFTNLLTVAATLLTDWDADVEIYANVVLGVVNVGLVALIFGRRHSALLPWALPAFAAIYLTLSQEGNWSNGFQTQWHFVVSFLLIGILAVTPTTPTRWTRILAIMAGIGATFSLASGVLVWAIVPVVAVLYANRLPTRNEVIQYGAWIIIGGAVVLFYLNADALLNIPTQEDPTEALNPPPIETLLRVAVGMVGAPLAFRNVEVAQGTGALGIFAMLLMALYWRRDLRTIAPWLGVAAYGVGTASVIALGRTVGANNLDELTLESRFYTGFIPFWLATVALLILTIHDLLRRPAWRPVANIALLYAGVIAMLWLRTTVVIGAEVRTIDPLWTAPGRDELLEPGNCLHSIPTQQDESCLFLPENINPLGRYANTDKIYQLAVHRLGIFADDDPVNVLPTTYTDGAPVLVQASSRWGNLYIREMLLNGVPDAALIHVSPDPSLAPALEAAYPRPLTANNDLNAAQQDFAARLGEQGWYIRDAASSENDANLFAAWSEAGYAVTPAPILADAFRTSRFGVFRLQRAPADLSQTRLRFGDEGIRLVEFDVIGDPVACNELRVQSWWVVESIPAQNYSLTVILANGETNLLNRDAAIGDIPAQLLEVGVPYFDERVLPLPCDLPTGAYDLRLGMYWQDDTGFPSLAITDADGDERGDRATVKMIAVME